MATRIQILEMNSEYQDEVIAKQQAKIDELIDFAIWMTGCGYDFCQHKYFIEQRDKLLKGEGR